MHLGQLLKETIILLISMNVIWLLIPRWIKRTIKGVTRLVWAIFKEVDIYAKRAFKSLNKKNKKAIPKVQEQPLNVITVTYPNGNIKKYPKAK